MVHIHSDDAGATGVGLPAMVDGPAEPVSTAAVLLSPILTQSVGRAMTALALPVLAEQILGILVGYTDLYLAGTVGAEATAAVGLAAYSTWLIGLIFGLVGTGATALVARAFGERSYDDANRFANQAVVLGFTMGLMAAVSVFSLASWIPAVFGLHSAAAGLATQYVRIEAIGHVMFGVLLVGNACLRGGGDTRTPLYLMVAVNICNVLVSVPLTLGVGEFIPGLGVTGIATGTAVARMVGGLLLIVFLVRGWGSARVEGRSIARLLRLHVANLRPHYQTLRRLLRIGIPAGMDGLALWAGHAMFLRIINAMSTGDEQTATLAAHVTGIRIEALSYLPAFAWATAAATMVGQSLGARMPERAVRSGHVAAMQAAALTAVLGGVYLVFAPQFYGFFSDDPRVIEIGVPALRLLAFFQIPLGLEIVYRGSLRGAGDTRFPLLFTLLGMLAIRVSVAYLGGHVLQWGLIGAWLGMCTDLAVRGALMAWRFRQGGWQRIRV